MEGQIVASMLDEYETIQQLFADAIAGASENFKNAEVDTAKNASSENKFSLRVQKLLQVHQTNRQVSSISPLL